MNKEQTKEIKKYNRIKLVLSLANTIFSFGLILILLFFNLTKEIEAISFYYTLNHYAALIIFIGITGFISSVVSFPFSFYSGFILEHKYNLCNQTFFQWLWESVKGLLVSSVIGIPLIVIFYFLLLTYESNWWLPVGLTMFVVSVVLSRIAPILILPLFYKLTPLADSPLKEKILSLTKTTSMHVEGIYSFNLSKTTKKANAAFTGIGKSKRILLGDTLMENFTEEEIETVFAHELGHYSHGHIKKNIFIGTISIFIGLYCTSLAYSASLLWFGFSSSTQLAALPLLMLWLGIYSLVTSPLGNILSRKYEFEADAYAVQQTNNKTAFVSTMKKLAAMNMADTAPHPIIEFLFYSHPSIEKRIRAAETLL